MQFTGANLILRRVGSNRIPEIVKRITRVPLYSTITKTEFLKFLGLIEYNFGLSLIHSYLWLVTTSADMTFHIISKQEAPDSERKWYPVNRFHYKNYKTL